MPITQEEFELGATYDVLRKTMGHVYEYLKAHADLAFTKKELQEVFPDGAPLESVLLKLEELGAAEIGWVHGASYYTLGPKPLKP